MKKTAAPMTKRKANTKAKREPNTLVLRHPASAKGKTPDELTADATTEGIAANGILLQTWSKYPFGALDITALVRSLDAVTASVKRGDMSTAESLLITQAVSLNAIFVNLAKRSALNMTEYLDATERYMRLALKAQGQCRATLETLAVIKNPPVFTRQANISSGPQQVNNGPVLNGSPSRAPIQESAPNEVLEGVIDGERMDGRTEGTTGQSNSAVETVGALDGTKDKKGKGASLTKRLPRRRTPNASRTR